MKRLLLAAAGLAGSLLFIPTAAHAASDPDPGVMVAASGMPWLAAEVVTVAPAATPVATPPLPRYTVVSGDTLSAIGARFHRSWPALAAYNKIPNPNLIYVAQVITIPPASYSAPAPAVVSAPVTYSAPVQHTYTAPQRTYVAPQRSYSTAGSGVWGCIAQHESGGNPATNTGNGYYGAFQDTIGSWRSAGGGPGLPSDYSYSEQLRVNQVIQQQQGWGAWPNTSRMCGA